MEARNLHTSDSQGEDHDEKAIEAARGKTLWRERIRARGTKRGKKISANSSCGRVQFKRKNFAEGGKEYIGEVACAAIGGTRRSGNPL